MWGRFRRKEDIGALQKALARFRRSTRATKREDVIVVVYGNAVRLGFVVLLILVIISLAFWLLRRRRTREETTPVPLEAEEEAAILEDEVVVPPGPPSGEDVTPRGDPPLGEERPDA
jgi:hypothetical protein